MFEKLQTGEKSMMHQDSLQPSASDLRSNAYRSLPGNQDIFSLLFFMLTMHAYLTWSLVAKPLLFFCVGMGK